MRHLLRAVIVILILAVINTAYSQNFKREEIIGHYIFRLAEHIQWANAKKISEYHFHVIDNDRTIEAYLSRIAKQVKVHNKPVKISYSNNDMVTTKPHLIYVSKSFTPTFNKIKQQTDPDNTLLISNAVEDKNQIMINLLEGNKNSILFEINKANIINRNLGANPDIILLGGTEIDVAALYKKGKQRLIEQQTFLQSISNKLSALEQKKAQLDEELHAKTKQLETNNVLSIKQSHDLARIKDELDEYQHNAKQQEEIIREREQDIIAQKDEIDKRHIILNSQQENIDAQKLTIIKQENRLRSIEETLDQKESIILSQQRYILFGIVIIGLMSAIAIIMYRNSKATKQMNIKLEQVTEKLAAASKRASQARKESERANKSKSMFLAKMSHELRTPLNSILGFSEIIERDQTLSESVKRNINIINKSGIHLLSIINDVLDMSKIESGEIVIKNTPFNIKNVIAEIIDMLNDRINSQGLEFKYHIAADLPTTLITDEAKIRQIIINVLGNSIKFTKEGYIRLDLDWSPPEKSDDIMILHIKVEDTGIGIENNKLAQLFLPFRQVSNHNDIKGTGLGLSICHEFINLMDGNINVTSKSKHGTQVVINIPVEYQDQIMLLDRDSDKQPKFVTGITADTGSYRILNVDDNRDNLEYLSQILAPLDFEIKSALNGKEALEIIEDWPPDLIWMDWDMPVMDGITATEKIRKLPVGNQIKIIALTANAFNDQKDYILNSGFDDLIIKPFKPEDIYEAMSRELDIEYNYARLEPLEPKAALAPEQFANLPDNLQAALRDAILELDIDRLHSLREEIDKHNSMLAEAFKAALDEFQLALIDKALNKSS